MLGFWRCCGAIGGCGGGGIGLLGGVRGGLGGWGRLRLAGDVDFAGGLEVHDFEEKNAVDFEEECNAFGFERGGYRWWR